MERTRLKYRGWTFEVDKELTRAIYQQVLNSGADICKCKDCRNYIAHRDAVFPREVRELFEELGIDYKKEAEITGWDYANGRHYVGGWFHFKGRILEGKHCKMPEGSDTWNIELTEVSDGFLIGFSNDNALSNFKNEREVVQVEFYTSIPWLLEGEDKSKK